MLQNVKTFATNLIKYWYSIEIYGKIIMQLFYYFGIFSVFNNVLFLKISNYVYYLEIFLDLF